MVKVIIPSEESDKVTKHLLRALKLFTRIGIVKQRKNAQYYKTKSQKNRESKNKLRQIKKHNRRTSKVYKHRFM